LLATYCSGVDLIGVYADGSCGTFDSTIEFNSPSCGYVPPTTTPPPTASPTASPTAPPTAAPTAPPSCRTYEIVGYNLDEYVDGTYTNCGGGSDSFSFYGGPGPVGSVCAQPSSVYITSGNGAANDIGAC
jgi:hypothetical protein